ncbi:MULTISPECIES: helix-turn-helix domain-containing protein [unclassified Streptomyces]|uniref:PucR family transcriptional regulator n=1 Tax=unclassified Streptomyces TaxID=2593676 RepID=UPI0033BA324E
MENEPGARIAALCDQVATQRIPQLVERILHTLWQGHPNHTVAPEEQQREWVRQLVRDLLSGIAERRPPDAGQVAAVRELGAAQARAGTPLPLLFDICHIAHRETWETLLREVDAYDPEMAGPLAHEAGLLWVWVRVIGGAIADAHGEESSRERAAQIALRHRFLDALASQEPDTEATAALARALGFQPDGDFQAHCMSADHWPDDLVESLQRRLATIMGVGHCVTRGASVLVLTQRSTAERVLEIIRAVEKHAQATVGVGLVRPGLAGASDSIRDSAAALSTAGGRGGTIRFAEGWLTIALAPQAQRLSPLLARAVEAARRTPHLAEAVRAYADNGLSIAAAGRALNLHPNSVAYRLDRWHEASGWNPREGEGLVSTLVALRLLDVSAVER